MQVKGVVFLARKSFIIKKFGQERWSCFFGNILQKDPFYNHDITPISLIPLENFLFFEDAMLLEFFDGDESFYCEFGEESAEYSLRDGPYKVYTKSGNLEIFVNQYLSSLWDNYYEGGKLSAMLEDNKIHLYIKNLPIPHIQFEYVIIGYMKKALEIMKIKLIGTKKIKGISSGDKEVYYVFELKV